MNWLGQLFSRKQLFSDLSSEIRDHLEERAQELMATGMPENDAITMARREFGNATLLEEHSREIWQWNWIESILRDLRFAVRQLSRNPGFTFTVIITLTLAIGANTVVFSLVDALLLRPLPYPNPERLAGLTRHLAGVTPSGHVIDEYEDGQDGETWELVRDHVPAAQFAALSYDSNGVNLMARNQLRYVQDHRVSATYFHVLGINPLLGRTFTQEEDRPNGPNAAILSYGLWHSVFGADPDILGQIISVKGEPHTIVGVMPVQVQPNVAADLWTPIRPWTGGEGGGDNYQIIMRLDDGATWAQVNSQLHPLHPALFNNLFHGLANDATKELVAKPLQEDLAQEKRKPTLILMGAVTFILLIAVANLAGLLLVRITRRQNEIATRLALGASPSAMVRQVFMEPLLLALAGTVCGLAAAFLVMKSFVHLFPPGLLPLGGVQIDGRVLIFTLLCMGGVCLLIGILPALAARQVEIRPFLADRSSSAGARSGRSRQVLIACEVSLTLVLLAGSGLLVRTLVFLQTLPAGFDPANVLTASASLDDTRYHDAAAFQKLVRESVAAMQRIPGVESVAMGLSLPYQRGLNDGVKVLDGPKAGLQSVSSAAYVTADYFHALRIPLLAGRTFTEDDTSSTTPVVLVNTAFAKKYLGTLDVVGLHVALGKTAYTIIGLTGDVKKRPGVEGSAPLATEAMLYEPYTQVDEGFLKLVHVWFQPSWLVRTHGPVNGLPDAMQAALAKADPMLPFAGFHPLSDLQSLALSQQRVEVLLLTVLSGLALIISVVGIYGLVSNVVAQRRREIGIRMALGCTIQKAMIEVAGTGLAAVGFGLGCGLLLAFFALRLMKSELYGVRSLDPISLTTVSLFLLFAALLASFAPTLRVARINPASTLRAD